jgi:hypothetical protein
MVGLSFGMGFHWAGFATCRPLSLEVPIHSEGHLKTFGRKHSNRFSDRPSSNGGKRQCLRSSGSLCSPASGQGSLRERVGEAEKYVKAYNFSCPIIVPGRKCFSDGSGDCRGGASTTHERAQVLIPYSVAGRDLEVVVCDY